MSRTKTRTKAHIPRPYVRIAYTGRHPPGTRMPYAMLSRTAAPTHTKVLERHAAMRPRTMPRLRVVDTPPKQARNAKPQKLWKNNR